MDFDNSLGTSNMDPRVGTTETFSVVKKCALSIQKVFSKSFRGTWFHKGQQNSRTHMAMSILYP